MAEEERIWQVTGALAGVAAGAAARKLLVTTWRRATDTEPPGNPASPRTGWSEAFVWAVASGVAVAVARLVAQRGAAGLWKATTGRYPAGLDEVSP